MSTPIREVNIVVTSINAERVTLTLGYENRTMDLGELRALADDPGSDAWGPVLANIGLNLGQSVVDWDNLITVKNVIESRPYKMHRNAAAIAAPAPTEVKL